MKSRFLQLFEYSPDAMVMVDRAGQIHEANNQAEQLFGYLRSEAVGHEMAALIIPPEFREAHRVGMMNYLAKGVAPILRRVVEVPALGFAWFPRSGPPGTPAPPARLKLADDKAVRNEFFGRGIGVAGLLTGRDVRNQVAALADPGDAVLVPAVALRDGDGVFLDDLTPADLARDLGVAVRAVEPDPRALLRALCGSS